MATSSSPSPCCRYCGAVSRRREEEDGAAAPSPPIGAERGGNDGDGHDKKNRPDGDSPASASPASSSSRSPPAASSLLRCGGCQSVWYCCKEHQKLDWNRKGGGGETGEGHKKECRRLREASEYATKWCEADRRRREEMDPETRADVERGDWYVRGFLAGHPCPPREWTLQWVSEGGVCPGEGLTSDFLVGTRYEQPDLKGMLLDHGVQEHEYPRLSKILCRHDVIQKLWTALASESDQDRIRHVREAGIVLNEHGGLPCMQFHYYMFHFLVAGGVYYPRPGHVVPDSQGEMAILNCHRKYFEYHWHGIGRWMR